jgi:hypothetical protein
MTLTQAPMGRFWRAAQLHCYLALGLTLLLGELHQSVPLVSPLANFIAVPIVALAIVRLLRTGIVSLAIYSAGATVF